MATIELRQVKESILKFENLSQNKLANNKTSLGMLDSDNTRNGVLINLNPGQVRLDSGEIISAHISGKIRKNFVQYRVGMRVVVERAPYDLTRWRIIGLSEAT